MRDISRIWEKIAKYLENVANVQLDEGMARAVVGPARWIARGSSITFRASYLTPLSAHCSNTAGPAKGLAVFRRYAHSAGPD